MIIPKQSLQEYPLKEMLAELTAGNKVKDKLPEPFFRHAEPFLAQNIPLVVEDGLISPSKTISRMKEKGNELANIIFKMYAILSRTDIMNGSQGKKPQYSSAVPLTMAALKEHQGIKYNEWNKEDPSIVYFLGSGLKGLYDMQKIEPLALTSEDVHKYRSIGMTYSSGKKEGTTEPPTAWKLNKLDLVPTDVHRNDMINRMLLQTWVFNAELRHTNMILDPWDWDLVPEPWDISVQDLAKSSKIDQDLLDGLPF